jgi:hypothetical protein
MGRTDIPNFTEEDGTLSPRHHRQSLLYERLCPRMLIHAPSHNISEHMNALLLRCRGLSVAQ